MAVEPSQSRMLSYRVIAEQTYALIACVALAQDIISPLLYASTTRLYVGRLRQSFEVAQIACAEGRIFNAQS
ncbi:hypothetical protein CC79DRAFT_1367205 [Sarocladium strictum]